MKFSISILIIVLSLQFSYSQNAKKEQHENYVVVLSLDGFRWDYLDSFPTPNLHRLAKKGVRAKSIIPCFPSVTFPNHYSMATGLYPDNHGLVNNSFYDSVLNYSYKISDRKAVENGLFYSGEPIWNTAEKQGMQTAIFYWVGSEADIQQMRPTRWKKYDESVPYEERVDTVIHWLSLPEKNRPNLIMFYFDEPDHVGHKYGPWSTETREMVMRCDSMVGLFLKKLKKLPLANKVNFIITSDHGMAEVSDNRKVILTEYMKKNWYKRINGYNPVINIEAEAGYEDSIYYELKKQEHISIWKKEEVPGKLNYGNHTRIDDILVLADSAWSISTDYRPISKGAHGYDPANTDMHGLFIARGPDFRRNLTVNSFENIHLYALLAAILRIRPVKNDGNFEKIGDVLKNIESVYP